MNGVRSFFSSEPAVVTRTYEALLLTLFALSPALAIGYIALFQDSNLRIEAHLFHEIAIAISIVESAFIAVVTWICYRTSGERLLIWLALAFAGFGAIYAPHGMLTDMSHGHMTLFLIYGPISRLFMGACLLIGLLQYGLPRHEEAQRIKPRRWLLWLGCFAVADALITLVVCSPMGKLPNLNHTIETLAIVLDLSALAVLLYKRYRSPMMVIYAIAIVFFVLSSVSFLLSKPWNHQWWLAHVIFAAGFFLLSYGVIRAFHTTKSFSDAYSLEEWGERLTEAKNRAESALNELEKAHKELKRIAITDELTGIHNRHFLFDQAETEIARALRQSAPLILVMLDIDHFKHLNDEFGHLAGDEVLRKLSSQVQKILRPGSLFGRLGGEEFVILLVDTSPDEAKVVAERIRNAVEELQIPFQDHVMKATVSLGLSFLGPDGSSLTTLLNIADRRLYAAKHLGRNSIVSDDEAEIPNSAHPFESGMR